MIPKALTWLLGPDWRTSAVGWAAFAYSLLLGYQQLQDAGKVTPMAIAILVFGVLAGVGGRVASDSKR